MKDLHSGVSVVASLGVATRSADADGTAVDLQGYESAEILVVAGIGGITFDGSNKLEIKITDSDDDSTYAEVTAGDILGETAVGSGGIIKEFVAAHAAAAVYRFGYVGEKRYIKARAEFTGTHGTGTPIAVLVVRGHPHVGAVADAA